MHRGALRWRATLLVLGTIIGAGIFGVPAMIGAWGILPSTLAFIVLTGIVMSAHLYLAEGLVANKDHARFAGQSRYWLGKGMGNLGGMIQSLQIFGSNLAYVILGGEFMRALLEMWGIEVPLIILQLVFWIIGAGIVFYGLERVSRAEVYLTWSLIVIVLIITGAFILQENPFSLAYAFPRHWNGFEPYGVFLFSLMGISALPEAAEVVGYRKKDLFKVIIRAVGVAAILTYLYGITAWAASGGTLGRDPAEVIRFLPTTLAFIVPLFGLVAVMTSFISSALDLRNLFNHDYHFPISVAWCVSLGIPLILLFLTSRDFMSTIGLVGSVFAAGLAIMATLIGKRALDSQKKRKQTTSAFLWRSVLPYIIILFFVAGGALWLFAGSHV